jgi:transposase-like protein
MSNIKRSYPEEFRLEAIAFLESSGKSAAAVERELGITPGLLSRWRRNQEERNRRTNGHRPETDERKRVRELERENTTLRQEREILKKVE